MSEHTLRERIQAVSNAEADGEQLVSVAVTPDDSVETMRQRVEESHAEAEYLDVREEVRRPLQRALEGTRRTLHEYDETPENGLAAYVGVVGDDLVEYTFDDLPSPVSTATYTHANEFDTEPLEPPTDDASTVGLLVVARERAVLGRYDGTTVERVTTVESDVPSKQAAAGRTEDRFEGRSDERRDEFFDEVGEAAARAFLDGDGHRVDPDEPPEQELSSVSGLLLGGSGVMVERFRNGHHLPDPFEDAVAGVFDVDYAAEQGLRQLVDTAEAADALATTEAREALGQFFDTLDARDDLAVGGPADVEEALEHEAVERLLIADSYPPEAVRGFETRVQQQGGEAVVVPADLDRAERLRNAFDGVGALLRFPV